MMTDDKAFREQRLKRIFKVCYEFLDKYKDGIEEQDWTRIHDYHLDKLDGADELAVAMYVACVRELQRQYEAQVNGRIR